MTVEKLCIGIVLLMGVTAINARRGPILILVSWLQHISAAWRWIRREAIPAIGRVRCRYWECLREVRSR